MCGKREERTVSENLTLEQAIDNAPMNRFHRKLVFLCGGGPFLDGYALTIIGFAFIQMSPQLGLSGYQEGLIGTAALVGIFVGGLFFGNITDRIGRQIMYTINLLTLVVMSLLSALASEPWQVIAARLLLGVAIGADYPIATSLLAEFLPARRRGTMLGTLITSWSAGALLAAFVGWALSAVSGTGWRWMLASSAVFGIVIVLARVGTPESPRWLLSKGRIDEARAAVKQVFDLDLPNLTKPAERPQATIADVFRGGYLKHTIFVGVFWGCQIVPLYAVATFGPMILRAMNFGSDVITYLGVVFINALILIGCFPGLRWVEKFGRRPLVIWGFVFMTVGLALLVGGADAPLPLVVIGFVTYALAAGAANILEWVYPQELFPTHIRATAVGVGTAMSRIWAAAGTFLIPVLLLHFGLGVTMLFQAAVTLVGLIVSVFLAVETKGRPLDEASSVTPATAQRPAPDTATPLTTPSQD